MVGLVAVVVTPPNAVPLNIKGMFKSKLLVLAVVNLSLEAVAAVTVMLGNEGLATLVAFEPALNPTMYAYCPAPIPVINQIAKPVNSAANAVSVLEIVIVLSVPFCATLAEELYPSPP